MRALLVLSVLLSASVAAAQPTDITWTEIAAPYTRGTNAYFGSDTSWDGERLLVRSDQRLDVYRFDGVSAPVYEAQLVPVSTPTLGFPGSVVIDHGRVLATANGDPPSWALFEFALSGSTWSEVAHLTNPAATPGDGALVRVQIDGTRWATSQPYIGNNRGSVDVVDIVGTGPLTWTTANRRMLVGATTQELTGHSLLLRGNEVLVTVLQGYVGGSQAGRVTLYRDTGSGLTQVINIDNPTPSNADQFGDTTDMDASFIYIGAHQDDTMGNDAGAIYVYDRAGTLRQTILGTVANGELGGGTLEVVGDYMLTSVPTSFGAPGIGHLLLYRRDASGTWVPRADVPDLASAVRSYFGSGADMHGHTLVVGSGAATVGGVSNAGRVWWGTFSEPDGLACTTDEDCTHHHCISHVCAATGPDAGVDAAMDVDGGLDASAVADDTGVDAGPLPDTGVDAAAPLRDAGRVGDAGSTSDAAIPQLDAGSTPRIPLSCTCRAAGAGPRGSSALLLLGLVLLVVGGRHTLRRG